jgi:hypothetical protein
VRLGTLRSRLRAGWPIERVLDQPEDMTDMTDRERRRLRQRMIEVLATDVLGVRKGTLGAWRTSGQVPHMHRISLLSLGAEVGLPLEAPRDFEGWRRIGER